MEKVKTRGEVFTPSFVIDEILDLVGYNGKKIINKHIIDNSAGNGNFIIKIINRYCETFLSYQNDLKKLRKNLEKYIHAIEIDENNFNELLKRSNDIVKNFGIFSLNWDFLNKNTLFVNNYEKKMDFVVGNPPYVRVHNISKNELSIIKNMSFSKKGMTDFYIVFFELGLKMLKKNGILGYITPNSFFYSKSGYLLRTFMMKSKQLVYLKDYGHKQIFSRITTYSAISIFNKKNKKKWFWFVENNKKRKIIYSKQFIFDKKFKVIENKIKVKNGLATLNDGIFIKNNFSDKIRKIKVYKASNGEFKEIVWPYGKKGELLNFTSLNEETRKYLSSKKQLLEGKSHIWYSYGRNQGIKDISKPKIAVSNLLSSKKKCKTQFLKPNQGIYSGLYVINFKNSKSVIKQIQSESFLNFVRTLRKYKNGGYYTFSSKDLEYFLNLNQVCLEKQRY